MDPCFIPLNVPVDSSPRFYVAYLVKAFPALNKYTFEYADNLPFICIQYTYHLRDFFSYIFFYFEVKLKSWSFQ